jgi:hypothetical protein
MKGHYFNVGCLCRAAHFLTAEHVAGGPDAPDVESMLGSSTDNPEGHATSSVLFSGKLFQHPCPVLSFDNPPSAQFAK